MGIEVMTWKYFVACEYAVHNLLVTLFLTQVYPCMLIRIPIDRDPWSSVQVCRFLE
jgi:hypothetical protein